ncbi:MAG: hypothetical protein HY717_13575 [Planctomycetes bacterium]|nr:hypothetical protein [Planctomycetota bacterium]
MESQKRGWAVCAASGLGVVAVLLVALLNWDPIAVQYYSRHLRRKPELLFEFLREAEGSLKHRACDAYLDTEKGQERLFRAFVEQVLKAGFSDVAERVQYVQTGLIWFDSKQAHQAMVSPYRAWASTSDLSHWRNRELVGLIEQDLHKLQGKDFCHES